MITRRRFHVDSILWLFGAAVCGRYAAASTHKTPCLDRNTERTRMVLGWAWVPMIDIGHNYRWTTLNTLIAMLKLPPNKQGMLVVQPEDLETEHLRWYEFKDHGVLCLDPAYAERHNISVTFSHDNWGHIHVNSVDEKGIIEADTKRPIGVIVTKQGFWEALYVPTDSDGPKFSRGKMLLRRGASSEA